MGDVLRDTQGMDSPAEVLHTCTAHTNRDKSCCLLLKHSYSPGRHGLDKAKGLSVTHYGFLNSTCHKTLCEELVCQNEAFYLLFSGF